MILSENILRKFLFSSSPYILLGYIFFPYHGAISRSDKSSSIVERYTLSCFLSQRDTGNRFELDHRFEEREPFRCSVLGTGPRFLTFLSTDTVAKYGAEGLNGPGYRTCREIFRDSDGDWRLPGNCTPRLHTRRNTGDFSTGRRRTGSRAGNLARNRR